MRQTFGRRISSGPFWNQLQSLSAEMFDRLDNGGAFRAFAPAFPALNVWEEGRT
jgi:hypothetical protein